MQNLDSIFLDRLEIKDRENPKLWSPYKNSYITLLGINKNYITLRDECGRIDKMPRSEEHEQSLLWPSKESNNWNKWRSYLFEDRKDFIAPLSYILQSKTGNHVHLTETICRLPYLLIEVKTGKVLNAKGEILIIDINKYRYANQREIDAFLDIASTFINIEWIKSKKIWSWATYYTTEAKPKFIPGDLVSIKDYITGDIFEGCYIISDIIEVEEGKYSYKLISDSFFAMKLIEVIVEEDKLVKCEVIVNKEKPNIETKTTTEKPKEEIKEDKVEVIDDDFLL